MATLPVPRLGLTTTGKVTLSASASTAAANSSSPRLVGGAFHTPGPGNPASRRASLWRYLSASRLAVGTEWYVSESCSASAAVNSIRASENVMIPAGACSARADVIASTSAPDWSTTSPMRRSSRTSGATTGSAPSTTQTMRQTPLAASLSTMGLMDAPSYTTTTRGGTPSWRSLTREATSLTSAPVARETLRKTVPMMLIRVATSSAGFRHGRPPECVDHSVGNVTSSHAAIADTMAGRSQCRCIG